MHFELERADAVGDAFDVIAQAMGEIVHRINAPLVAGVMMLGVPDPVEHRVAQPDVGRRHVDLRAQRAGAVGKLAGFHARKKVEVFLDGAIAKRHLLSPGARDIRRCLRASDRRRRLCLLDELDREFVELVEIVGGVERLRLACGLQFADGGR